PHHPREEAIRPLSPGPEKRAEPTLPLLELPSGAKFAVAIDLGTTRSSVATVIDGRVSMLRLPGGDWDIPSVVGFRADRTVVVGNAARRMLSTDVANVIVSPKRLLGRRMDEPALGPYLARLGMKATAGPRNEIVLHARGHQLSVTEACAHLLKLLRLVAEHNLGRPVREVIMTIPATAGDRQVRALSDAAAQASLRVIEFLQEPVSAAMACIFDDACRGLIAIYDFGGGTFDFSIVDLAGEAMEVVATSGDSWLGGDDFDAALAGAAANACWQQHRVELRHQAQYWQALLVAAERAKCALSEEEETVLRLPGVLRSSAGEADFEFSVTRKAFAKMTKGIVDRSLETCQEALASAHIGPEDLSAIYLSGGTSYIPAVREGVAAFFGREPRTVVPPERMVVLGAAVHGALMGSPEDAEAS
ncbi:MAG: Hsp70 family protein, partial [Deltaproteobacteria bacterium]|nr:Hsp70 family protein [Deltaproteobacteria bacterium]